MTDVFIEFKGVDFAYGKKPVLKNINLTIDQGDFSAIIGGSGCGKTTLLRLITGQVSPTRGDVLIQGRSLRAFSQEELYEYRRQMGVLFQFGALFTDLSVYENIAFPIREHTNLPEDIIRDLVLLKLNAVGLRGSEYLMPTELSGGMSRRVALARSIALDPSLMLFDEPFSGLDPISLGVIVHLIAKINKAFHSTSIMVTHDMTRSLQVVDHVIFLSQGEVLFAGKKEEMDKKDLPILQQFISGSPYGPVDYRYPAKSSLEEDLMRGLS